MKYLTVSEARHVSGLRLALTAGGVVAPWCDAAKAFFKLRNVPFVAVEQIPFEANEELVAWTGIRNAPIAIHENEAPRSSWLDIVMLAEQLGSGPSLLPADPQQRALCLGIATEIASENGFGWICRMLTLSHLFEDDQFSSRVYGCTAEACRQYRYTPDNVAVAIPRLNAILHGLAAQLLEQRAAGSDYFVGQHLSVADVLWATFSMFIAPPSLSVCPMPEWQHRLYSANYHDIGGAIDQVLMDHRDMVLDRHFDIPLDI